MHYYKRNLGDYAKKAGRLSMLQHGAYTLLIDACYDREQFPTLDEAIDWTWASSTAEVEAVEFVLRKFFTLEDGRFVQKRIQEEIDSYHGKSETNARIAREREAKRRAEEEERARLVNGSCGGGDEPPPNQEPLTNNQEPKEEGNAAALPPTSEPKARKSKKTTLATYLKACKDAGVKPVPEGHELRDWCAGAGVTHEMLQIAWLVFRDKYTLTEGNKAKLYADWPGHFARSVKFNWDKLWISDKTGEVQWSTTGLMHKRALDEKIAEKAQREHDERMANRGVTHAAE